MSQADREARLCAAIYRTYGRAAEWVTGVGDGASCTIRLKTFDGVSDVGLGHVLQRAHIIFVRVSEVAHPAKSDRVRVGQRLYKISRDPRLEDDGLEWLCEAVEAGP